MRTLWALFVAMAVEGASQHIDEVPVSFVNRILYEGDRCASRYGGPGVCSKLKNCERIVQDIQAGKRPTICSFDKEESIVCCPVSAYNQQSLAITNPIVKDEGDRAREACDTYIKMSNNWSRRETCISPINPLGIINGRNADHVETPHVAAIGYGDDIAWLCGGSLISSKFVITAGHCLQSPQRGPAKWVRLGDLNLADPSDDANAQQFSVSERIPHPDYRPPSHYNDVGLLRLDREIVWNEYVHPACLHMSDAEEYQMSALGWGLTDWAAAKGSDNLMTTFLTHMPVKQCQESVKSITGTRRLSHGYDNATMLCVGDLISGSDTCKGDSGGPLQKDELKDYRCIFYIIGITSFGSPVCGAKSLPAVYSRVAHFVPWIESVVWP